MRNFGRTWAAAGRCIPCTVPVVAGLGYGSLRGYRRDDVRCDSTRPVSTCSVGCYNVLCSTYAVKWSEREGVGPDGASNWAARWPVMREVIQRAAWDVVCLQEVEHCDVEGIRAGLGNGYEAYYFKHVQRPPDGVLIAVRKKHVAGAIVPKEMQWRDSVAFGRVDFVLPGGEHVRVVTGHMRGGNDKQLADLAAFADEGDAPDVTVVTGDFNEDFGTSQGKFRCPLPDGPLGAWSTLQREIGLPTVSRPPHKQMPDQTSGKGKIDFIFVRGRTPDVAVELFRDPGSLYAVLASHGPCEATGQWPSDHGCEGLSIRVSPCAKL